MDLTGMLRMMKAELVEGTLLSLVAEATEECVSGVLDFVSGVLTSFEVLWEDFDELTTRAIASMCSCLRALQVMCNKQIVPDEDSFKDLQLLQDGSSGMHTKSIVGMIGNAVFANDEFSPRLVAKMKAKKHVLIARPEMEEICNELDGTEVDQCTVEHFTAL